MRTALIFAGGRASRLDGANKGLFEVGGSTIVARVLTALESLVDERILLGGDALLPELREADVRLVRDPAPHAGVLPALAAGLREAAGDVCLTTAWDMPFASRALFEYLIGLQQSTDADVVVPRSSGVLEPMHAVYRRQPVLRAVQAALGRGERRMTCYFSDVRVREVDDAEWRLADPSGNAFFNVNTAADLDEARRIAAWTSNGSRV